MGYSGCVVPYRYYGLSIPKHNYAIVDRQLHSNSMFSLDVFSSKEYPLVLTFPFNKILVNKLNKDILLVELEEFDNNWGEIVKNSLHDVEYFEIGVSFIHDFLTFLIILVLLGLSLIILFIHLYIVYVLV